MAICTTENRRHQHPWLWWHICGQAEAETVTNHKPALHVHQEMQTSRHNRIINFKKKPTDTFFLFWEREEQCLEHSRWVLELCPDVVLMACWLHASLSFGTCIKSQFGPQERRRIPTESSAIFPALLRICLEAPPFQLCGEHHFQQTGVIQNPWNGHLSKWWRTITEWVLVPHLNFELIQILVKGVPTSSIKTWNLLLTIPKRNTQFLVWLSFFPLACILHHSLFLEQWILNFLLFFFCRDWSIPCRFCFISYNKQEPDQYPSDYN